MSAGTYTVPPKLNVSVALSASPAVYVTVSLSPSAATLHSSGTSNVPFASVLVAVIILPALLYFDVTNVIFVLPLTLMSRLAPLPTDTP